MPTFKVNASNNDKMRLPLGTLLGTTGTKLGIQDAGGGNKFIAYIIIPSVIIPAGSTINSATARVFALGNNLYNVYSIKPDLANTSAPTPSPTVLWTSPAAAGSASYQQVTDNVNFNQFSFDLTSAVQALVDNFPGAYDSPGSNMLLRVYGNGPGYLQSIRAYDYSSGAEQAELEILYTAGGGGGGGTPSPFRTTSSGKVTVNSGKVVVN